MCKVLRAVEESLRGYKDRHDGFERLWSIVAWWVGKRNRVTLRGIGRGVSRPCQAPKIVIFSIEPCDHWPPGLFRVPNHLAGRKVASTAVLGAFQEVWCGHAAYV
jgi:hypothetical protein